MIKKIFLLGVFLPVAICSFAQSITTDSLSAARDKERADSLRMVKLESQFIYPYINGGKYSGVIPVENPEERPDLSLQYKLLFELIQQNGKDDSKDINAGLTEICRRINLHVASGIPVKNLSLAVIVHGPALYSFVKNDSYQKRYKTSNPNIDLIKKLQEKGVHFMACGQAMSYFDVQKDELVPGIHVSLTAQTVLTSYQVKGYMLFQIKEEK